MYVDLTMLEDLINRIVIAYSLVIIPRELKDDDPIKEIITMIKILTNMRYLITLLHRERGGARIPCPLQAVRQLLLVILNSFFF